jgi:RNA polymerase sigma-70 factor, ECF subfamily
MADYKTMPDEQIVQYAQQGRLDAFTAIYERYLPTVYNRVRFTIPSQDVEDVTQEVFIAVMRSLKTFRGEARFSTWLRTIVNRQIADYYRRRQPQEFELKAEYTITQLSPTSQSLINTSTFPTDDLMFVRQALNRLPDKYKEILLLRFADGMHFSEIAFLNKDSLEATKSLFRRAVAALRKNMEDANA